MGVIDYIQGLLKEGFREIIRDIGEDLNEVVSRRINQIRKQIIRDIFGLLVIMTGIGLLVIAGIFFLIEYIALSRTLSFLIVGIIVLIIGIIIKATR